jgi:hypothetical protein
VDSEFDSGCDSGRIFYCPKSSGYGILWAEIWSSRKTSFYNFSTTFGGFDLPHFAAFCRVMNFILGGAGQI